MLSKTSLNTTHFKYLVFVLSCSFIVSLIYQPLPDDLKQPWKYRMICFSSEIIHYFGRLFESFNVIRRVDLIRWSFHIGIGVFNIRDPKDEIQIIDDSIDGIAIRIYRPTNRSFDKMPTILLYHGGGFSVGSVDILEPVSYTLAKETNFQVIYIEYRLVPEFSYPTYLTDSIVATKQLLNSHVKYLIDLKNLILCGDSAGGNIATVISQKLKEEKLARPKLQVLVYPMLQFYDFTLPSYRVNLPKRILGNINHDNLIDMIHFLSGEHVDESILYNGHTSRSLKESMFSEYVNHGYLPARFRNHNLGDIPLKNDTGDKFSKLNKIILDKNVSPLLVDDTFLVENTPDFTLLFTVEMDIVRDDGFIYAGRLKKLGLNVEHFHYENSFHGVWGLNYGIVNFNDAHIIMNDMVRAIKSIIN